LSSPVATATASEASPRRFKPIVATVGELPAAFEACALRLLACVALALLSIALLVLRTGPSESNESLSWVLAFALALPLGLILSAYQARILAVAAPAATARALAAGTVLLALALFLRRVGGADRLHHAILAAAAIAALAAPFAAAWRWRDPEDRAGRAGRAIALASLAALALLFVLWHSWVCDCSDPCRSESDVCSTSASARSSS
jgi:hypothetical protein